MACIYARYSTRFQDSVDDQIRECREWAEANGYLVPDELIFVDRGRRGGSSRREGLKAMRQVIEDGKVDAVIIFATSRLFRKTYRALQFVHEEIVERGIRCVFIKSGIDSGKKDDWEMRLHVQSLVDEYQTKSSKAHIRAAHIGLLLKRRVFGTLSFGYKGEVIPGEKTNTGGPARRIAADPETAPWVTKMFSWYVGDRLSMSEIVRRLNEGNAPLPPRCATGRWTYLAVRIVLTNPRYAGRWQYGRTEAKWLSKKDYVRQVERSQPLRVEHYEDLRIVDDETWFRAQELMADNPHNAGRKSVDGDRRTRPRLLNGLLFCGYHDRPLVVGGANGYACLCPVCKQDGRARLYTFLNRRLALKMICRRIAELVRGDHDLVGKVAAACKEAAEAQRRPDPGQLEALHSRRERLTKQIAHVLDLFADTDEDRRENQAKAAELRRKRSRLDTDLVRLEAAANKPIMVPAPEEVRRRLGDLASILTAAAEGGDEESFGEARRIIETVTGGQIMLYQTGPREPGKGWLKGVFKVQIVKVAAEQYGAHDVRDGGVEVAIEFRQPPVYEQIADEVKSLWDAGLMYTEIAEKVGWNRNIVTKAMAFCSDGASGISMTDV